jgi:BTB/POZ domain
LLLVADIACVMRRPAYWDIVFVLAGERIPLHRAVLAARSPYFHRMLRTAWLPPKVPPCSVVKISAQADSAPGTMWQRCDGPPMADLAFDLLQGGGIREVLLNPAKLSLEGLHALIVYLYRCLDFVLASHTGTVLHACCQFGAQAASMRPCACLQ